MSKMPREVKSSVIRRDRLTKERSRRRKIDSRLGDFELLLGSLPLPPA